MMKTENILALLRGRAEELKQQCEAKIDSLGIVSEGTQSDEQRRIRNSAQSDFDASAELYRLSSQIEGTDCRRGHPVGL
jgi:hypothetical protein